jgi:uncharacterized repeat protein (TIGR04076 family)
MKNVCELGFTGTRLKTGEYARTCRYHRLVGQEFQASQLLPPGCCPHLFIAAYAHSLGILYDAAFDGKTPAGPVLVTCPSAAAAVKVRVLKRYTFPEPIRELKKLAIRVCHKLGIPAEYPDRNVFLKVVQVEGVCPRGLRPGTEFTFNLMNRSELCPASFQAFYPVALQKQARGAAPGSDCSFHCPDPLGVFYNDHRNDVQCADFFGFRCRQGEDILMPERYLPEGFCPLAWYSAFPYYAVLTHGGWFEWVPPGENVMVQCPRSQGVVMEVRRVEANAPLTSDIAVEVKRVHGPCPQGLAVGQTFRFPRQQVGPIPLADIANLMPFAGHPGLTLMSTDPLKRSPGAGYTILPKENV